MFRFEIDWEGIRLLFADLCFQLIDLLQDTIDTILP